MFCLQLLRRLEHENAELRQRLGDIATLVNKQELQEYMNKNNVSNTNWASSFSSFIGTCLRAIIV